MLDEITQFCDWALIQIKKNDKKIYVVLYDGVNTSNLFIDIKNNDKYINENLILTNTNKFKENFLIWFNNIYDKNK